jgi:hypothetical protein
MSLELVSIKSLGRGELGAQSLRYLLSVEQDLTGVRTGKCSKHYSLHRALIETIIERQ